MIDLLNSWIKNEEGELITLWLEEATKQGYNVDYYTVEHLLIEDLGYCIIGECVGPDSVNVVDREWLHHRKELTLADLKPQVKPQVKTEYKKVVFDKLSEAFAEHEKAPLYCDDSGFWFKLDENNVFCNFSRGFPLYRKVETILTPMQAAKEACKEVVALSFDLVVENMIDYFLEESMTEDRSDIAFIKMCRNTVNAYDGKEK